MCRYLRCTNNSISSVLGTSQESSRFDAIRDTNVELSACTSALPQRGSRNGRQHLPCSFAKQACVVCPLRDFFTGQSSGDARI